MKRVGVAVLMLVVALVGVAGVASATTGGGNSIAAKACQQGGWVSLYRADGSAFDNAGACVSYAAQGGTLETQCQPGSWSTTGVTPCDPADVGFYVSTAGATSETACPAGETTAGTGSTSISECFATGPKAKATISGGDGAGNFLVDVKWSGFSGPVVVTFIGGAESSFFNLPASGSGLFDTGLTCLSAVDVSDDSTTVTVPLSSGSPCV